jgi:hypothetical protein
MNANGNEIQRKTVHRGSEAVPIALLSLVLAILLTGCSPQAPAHTDAWLSIKFGLGCGDYAHCTALTNFDEGNNYAIASGIGSTFMTNGNMPMTLGQWKQTYGYPGVQVFARAIYGNQLDLQFGRDMNCWDFGQGGVACYVANYGVQPGIAGTQRAPWPNLQQAFDDAIAQHNPFAIVAMAYNPNGIGVNGDTVTFAAFAATDKSNIDNSVAVPDAQLDEEGQKIIPQMCMACHGGIYDTTKHSVTGASFLPFDLWSFYYDSKITAGPYDDYLQNEFRKLNALVLKTNPNQPIVDLVNGLYGGLVNDLGAKIVDDTYVPPGWVTPDGSGQKLYKGVFRRYCRMCHTASKNFPFSTYAQFQTNATLIQKIITCGPSATVKLSHDMPQAEVPFGGMAGFSNEFGPGQGFWMDAFAQDDLNKFLASQPGVSCN